jgi:hypothetical protein
MEISFMFQSFYPLGQVISVSTGYETSRHNEEKKNSFLWRRQTAVIQLIVRHFTYF